MTLEYTRESVPSMKVAIRYITNDGTWSQMNTIVILSNNACVSKEENSPPLSKDTLRPWYVLVQETVGLAIVRRFCVQSLFALTVTHATKPLLLLIRMRSLFRSIWQ